MSAFSPLITTSDELAEFCHHLATADLIAFDTEFVSEDTFYPQLCLVQVATTKETVAIDAVALPDVAPLWDVLANGDHTTIVHAGREELRFSLRATETIPARLFDTQIAGGLVGTDFPASYGSLVSRFLRHRPDKGETRTDWRRRPLTDAQIRYALDDVRHLIPLYTTLSRRLEAMGRSEWLLSEMADWTEEIRTAENRPRWRRVSGVGGLPAKSMPIVRELWFWRQEEAKVRDIPPRRVLRDDLIIEIAKRRSADPERIRTIRGLYRGTVRRYLDDLASCVERGLSAPRESSKRDSSRDTPSQLSLLGQFLTPALTSICRKESLAASLVGTASDVRDLIAYRLEFPRSDEHSLPILASGWRAKVIGQLIEELLAGRTSIRIEDALSDHPLAFEKTAEK